MEAARLSVGTQDNGLEFVSIRSEYKQDAQRAIQAAKAFLKANGLRFKLVYFNEVPSPYSNLVCSYNARIVYRA